MQWKGSLSGIPGNAPVGGWLREKVTRDRKLEGALVDPSTALVCDALDEHGDADEMQGPSQQGVARMLEDMPISPSLM